MDFLLGLSVPVAVVLWVRWYYSLRLSPALRVTRPGRVAFGLIPVLCIIFLFAILKRFRRTASNRILQRSFFFFCLAQAGWGSRNWFLVCLESARATTCSSVETRRQSGSFPASWLAQHCVLPEQILGTDPDLR